MKLIRELRRNAAATGRLRPKYSILTRVLGLLAAGLGTAGMYYASRILGALLGLPMDHSAPVQPSLFLWIIGVLISVPVVYYAAMVFVGGLFAVFMVLLRNFTPVEARNYALLSQYPDHWFQSGNPKT